MVIMLREISQTEKGKYYMISHVKSKKQNRKRLTDTENKWIVPERKGFKVGKGDLSDTNLQT